MAFEAFYRLLDENMPKNVISTFDWTGKNN
jgi:hypothetical protein